MPTGETLEKLLEIDYVEEVNVDDDILTIELDYHIPTANGYQLRVETLRGIGPQISRVLGDDYEQIEKPEPIKGLQRFDSYTYKFEKK